MGTIYEFSKQYIDKLFDKNASEFSVDKKEGVFIPIDIRMDIQDFRKAIKELLKQING